MRWGALLLWLGVAAEARMRIPQIPVDAAHNMVHADASRVMAYDPERARAPGGLSTTQPVQGTAAWLDPRAHAGSMLDVRGATYAAGRLGVS